MPIRSTWLVVVALIGAVASLDARAQAFSQGFGTPPCGSVSFPSGWTRFNVDNLVPNLNAARFNQAWIIDPDPDGPGCVAASTSWYTPAGTANDFMCTPQFVPPAFQPALRWRARSTNAQFADGYEVRLLSGVAPTGGPGNIGNLLNGPLLFSIPEEIPAWQTRTFALDAFAGQTLSVCFRNNSFDKTFLNIDDVQVYSGSVDVATAVPSPPGLEYTQVPVNLGYSFALAATVTNVGNYPLSTAQVTAHISDASGPRSSVASAVIPALPFGATAAAAFPPAAQTVDTPGTWTVTYQAATQPADGVSANNTASETLFAGSELARDDGAIAITIGLGTEDEELGHEFDIPRDAAVSAVRVRMNQTAAAAGLPIVARLRRFDEASNTPGAVFASTIAVPGVASNAEYTLTFGATALEVPAGRYVATLVGPPPNAEFYRVAVGSRPARMARTWYRANGTWRSYEQLGLEPPQNGAPHLRLVLGPSNRIFADGFENAQATR